MIDNDDNLKEDTSIEDRFSDGFVMKAGDKVIHDGELESMYYDTCKKYVEKFGYEPDFDEVPEDKREELIEKLNAAITSGEPLEDDEIPTA